MVASSRNKTHYLTALNETPVKQWSYMQLCRYLALHERQISLQNVRFSTNIALQFHSHEIEQLTHKDNQWHVTINLVNTLGSCSALPYVYTEQTITKLHLKQRLAYDFINTITQQSIKKYYLANTKSQIYLNYEHGHMTGQHVDKHGNILAKLAKASIHDLVDLDFYIYNSGILSRGHYSSDMLAHLFSAYFQVPISFHSMQGQWLNLSDTDLSILTNTQNNANLVLANNATLGQRVYYCQSLIKLVIGPISLQASQLFQPEQEHYFTLKKMLKELIGNSQQIMLQIQIDPTSITPQPLGQQSLKLSWLSWLNANRPNQFQSTINLGALP